MRSFYRRANAIFGKVGRLAPEETILQLINTKICAPATIWPGGMPTRRNIRSLDFALTDFYEVIQNL